MLKTDCKITFDDVIKQSNEFLLNNNINIIPSVFVAGDVTLLVSPGNILFKVNKNSKDFIDDWFNYCIKIAKYKLMLSDAIAINGLIENLNTTNLHQIKQALQK